MDGVPTLQQAAGWGFAELWQMAKDYLAANIGEPLAFGLRAAGYLLVAGVLGLLAGVPNDDFSKLDAMQKDIDAKLAAVAQG